MFPTYVRLDSDEKNRKNRTGFLVQIFIFLCYSPFEFARSRRCTKKLFNFNVDLFRPAMNARAMK